MLKEFMEKTSEEIDSIEYIKSEIRYHLYLTVNLILNYLLSYREPHKTKFCKRFEREGAEAEKWKCEFSF